MKKKKKDDLLGLLLIAVCVIALIVGILWNLANTTVELDKTTRCNKSKGPNNYYVIIVDNTDILRPIQKSNVKKKIKGIVNKAGPNDKVIIYSLSNFSVDNTVPLIDKCSMRDGSDADKFTENAKLMKKEKSELFDAPIDEAVNNMLANEKDSKASPIIEIIQKIRIENLPDDIKNKTVQINLFSDLLQHSENFSFYKNYNLKKFLTSLEFKKISTDLSGIEFTIWQLINSRLDNIRLQDHWLEIFEKMNPKYLPTIEVISG
jgi:hypothetical protein